jgi:hypothetical protein
MTQDTVRSSSSSGCGGGGSSSGSWSLLVALPVRMAIAAASHRMYTSC